MTDVDEFLAKTRWENARREPIQGDASSRRYIRLYSGSKRAILMIDPQGDVSLFATIARHLESVGLSAPEVYAQSQGLMLLEDFGDDRLASVITNNPTQETALYKLATDVIVHLEAQPVPEGLTRVTASTLGNMLEPAFTHYLPAFGQPRQRHAAAFEEMFGVLLNENLPEKSVFVLRDHHAENMMWLPDRDGIRRIGLLDFQDAVAGPPIYDLVSMLQDARRDVSAACVNASLAHYASRTGQDISDILPTYHLLGLQRNLRILGIFVRLALERGKPGYLSLIPRVWAHVETNMAAPIAAPLRDLFASLFQRPSSEKLSALEARCRTP